jgi:hypothetical protein
MRTHPCTEAHGPAATTLDGGGARGETRRSVHGSGGSRTQRRIELGFDVVGLCGLLLGY